MIETETHLWPTEEELRDSWLLDVAGICPDCLSSTCYFFCPRSPLYYSPEREYEDDLRQERMSDSEWRAAAEYERFHDRWAS